MDDKKILTLQEVLEASKSSLKYTQRDPKLYEFFVDRPGKYNSRSHTYFAFGWGVQHLNGMVYWRMDCTEKLAGILDSHFIGAMASGTCPQGQRFMIHYRN